MTKEIKALPQWIWHEKREERKTIAIARRFALSDNIEGFRVRAAFTGAASVELDGVLVAEIAEHPNNIARYERVSGIPEKLAEGEHELVFRISCTEIMPIHEVNGYLTERRVGFSAFASWDGERGWLASDGEWLADGEKCAVVCVSGEEPFGDLDGAPEWFAAGGYGDVRVYPLGKPNVLESRDLTATAGPVGCELTGETAGWIEMKQPERERLELFYHLRKQSDWRQMREMQRGLESELDGAPRASFDLGKEHNARFRIENNGSTPVTVLWNGAESLFELEKYEGCITEWFGLPPGESFVTLPQGMRYVRLYVIGDRGARFGLSVSFESAHSAGRQIGTLSTDAGVLDRVYDVSAHTSRICHQIGLWDGIKRDRLNWTFDFYLAAKSCYFLWDDYEALKRAVRELGVGTPYGYWMNGIAEYTLWWMKTVCEYYAYTGDKSFVLEMKEPLQRHIRWISENIDRESGCLNGGSFILIEWTPLSEEEKIAGLQAILQMTREDLLRLAAQVPELELSIPWQRPRMAEERFANPDNLLATKVLGVLSGYVSEREARSFLEGYELKDPFTPLSAYQLAECYSLYGMHDRAYEVIDQVWGGMLRQGATTFWESFTLSYEGDFHDALTTYTQYGSYRISLCHAWSSTPVKWISETLLGVRAIEPGFAAIRFKPIAAGGIRRCSGTISTPHGPIRVTWELGPDGDMRADIDAPPAVRVVQEGGVPS